MSATVWRVQDSLGRGPFKPGFSRVWCEERADYPPGILEWYGVPDFRQGEFVGCGCRDLAPLARWFRPTELQLLYGFGYRVVRLQVSRVIAENAFEVIFARRKPLRIGASPIDVAVIAASGWNLNLLALEVA